MEEIFADISDEVKYGAKLVFDSAIKTKDVIQMTNILNNYVNNCPNEEERTFVHFYFNLRMEELINASNNVQR